MFVRCDHTISYRAGDSSVLEDGGGYSEGDRDERTRELGAGGDVFPIKVRRGRLSSGRDLR